MSKSDNWIKIDKGAVKTLGNLDRPYSVVEALVSHSVDVDCGKEWTINGYAKMWNWSRGKVRRFVKSLRTHSGHIADRKGTQSGHPVHLIEKGLQSEADKKRTHSGHIADSKRDTTIETKTKTKTKENNKECVVLAKSILNSLNIKANKNYRETDTNLSFILERMKEGYQPTDFEKAIDNQVAEWLNDTKMNKFLRPSTLFQKSKFDGYVNNNGNSKEVQQIAKELAISKKGPKPSTYKQNHMEELSKMLKASEAHDDLTRPDDENIDKVISSLPRSLPQS